MKEVKVPNTLTYIGAFLTFRCRYNCSYCINHYGKFRVRKEIPVEQWIEGLNRLEIEKDWMVPITLSGGEPSLYVDYIKLIKYLKPNFYIDMLTNLDFDIEDFMAEIPPERMQRDVPYASIRVSYHPEYSILDELIGKIYRLQKKGYSIGLFAVEHPETDLLRVRQLCSQMGIDFRTKEFLGWYKRKLYGTYKYAGALSGIWNGKRVRCKTTEILIAPDGNLHRCHRDLYYGENSIGNIMDKDLEIEFRYRNCFNFKECSPCDVKIKTDRFQRPGACSTEIKS